MILKLSWILSKKNQKKKKKPRQIHISVYSFDHHAFQTTIKLLKSNSQNRKKQRENTHTNHSNENIVKVICTYNLEHERSTIHKLKNPFIQKLNKWVSKWNWKRHEMGLWEERCHGWELEWNWGRRWNGFMEGRLHTGVGLGLCSSWISHLSSSPALDWCRSSLWISLVGMELS